MTGKLILVPTPIGNLEDITFRAIRTLKESSLILAEDTRTSGTLMKHYGITTPMAPFHAHNEHKALTGILQRLKAGEHIALISDAGTPGISDPGFLLARSCREQNIPVECLPGATALIPALVQSGFPTDRFVFEGFLPHQKGRQKRLQALIEENRTMVFYESPYRVMKALEEFKKYFGPERQVTVSRELSKKFEETVSGTLEEVTAYFTAHPPKGEFVMVVAGKH